MTEPESGEINWEEVSYGWPPSVWTESRRSISGARVIWSDQQSADPFDHFPVSAKDHDVWITKSAGTMYRIRGNWYPYVTYQRLCILEGAEWGPYRG